MVGVGVGVTIGERLLPPVVEVEVSAAGGEAVGCEISNDESATIGDSTVAESEPESSPGSSPLALGFYSTARLVA